MNFSPRLKIGFPVNGGSPEGVAQTHFGGVSAHIRISKTCQANRILQALFGGLAAYLNTR